LVYDFTGDDGFSRIGAINKHAERIAAIEHASAISFAQDPESARAGESQGDAIGIKFAV
jgi:hypothetical protein